MSLKLREMTIADYDAVLALWKATENIGLSEADEQLAIERYLRRNLGMSFVACDAGRIIGAVLCGHDGRRGFLHHLAVAKSQRCRGVGRQLVERCLAALAGDGIEKCHLFVFAASVEAIAFWQRVGWTQRVDLAVMSTRVPAGR